MWTEARVIPTVAIYRNPDVRLMCYQPNLSRSATVELLHMAQMVSVLVALSLRWFERLLTMEQWPRLPDLRLRIQHYHCSKAGGRRADAYEPNPFRCARTDYIRPYVLEYAGLQPLCTLYCTRVRSGPTDLSSFPMAPQCRLAHLRWVSTLFVAELLRLTCIVSLR